MRVGWRDCAAAASDGVGGGLAAKVLGKIISDFSYYSDDAFCRYLLRLSKLKQEPFFHPAVILLSREDSHPCREMPDRGDTRTNFDPLLDHSYETPGRPFIGLRQICSGQCGVDKLIRYFV